MGDAGSQADAKLTLYTNHVCPYAHRAHIVAKELGLEYEEVIIDLSVPRPDWYLKINPRGLVPTLVYSDNTLSEPLTIIESTLVVKFLLDTFPAQAKRISPPSTSVQSAYFNYRVNLLVDNWTNKVGSLWMKILISESDEELKGSVDALVKAIAEHIEPLLHDVNPFFGGSSNITQAEILVAPFLVRLINLSNGEAEPKMIVESLFTLPNFAKWAKHTIAQESVTYVWDQEKMVKNHAAAKQKLIARYKHTAKSD